MANPAQTKWLTLNSKSVNSVEKAAKNAHHSFGSRRDKTLNRFKISFHNEAKLFSGS